MSKGIDIFFKLTVFVVAGYFIFDFFYSSLVSEVTVTERITPELLTGAAIISGMAFALGTLNLFLNHIKRVSLFLRGWFFSLVLLLSLITTLSAGIVDLINNERANLTLAFISKLLTSDDPDYWKNKFPRLTKKLVVKCGEELPRECLVRVQAEYQEKLAKKGLPNFLFKFLTDAFFVPLGQAMFSLLAFFIASASFRAFRFNNYLSLALLVSALIVLLGQNGFVVALFPELVGFRTWLLNYVSSGVFKVINISAIIGGLIIAIRIWLSMDKSFK